MDGQNELLILQKNPWDRFQLALQTSVQSPEKRDAALSQRVYPSTPSTQNMKTVIRRKIQRQRWKQASYLFQ
jgi:hypothetical protein